MTWYLVEYPRPGKAELKRVLRAASFYADYDLDASIVEVLRHLKYDVETSQEIGFGQQRDEFHYRRAFKTKRVLLTKDKGYLDSERFPLSQTRGVIVFNIDTSNTKEIARALEVIDLVLAGIAPALDEAKVILNSDYTLTFIKRKPSNGGFGEDRTRYKFDENGRDIWIWEDED